MKVQNHDLTVRRNETFTMDRIIRNRDGSPYIISSKLLNPYFVITVSSSIYDVSDRYVYHAWLPVNVPRFHSTIPVRINDFKDEDGNELYPNGFDTMTGPPVGYVNGVDIGYGEDTDKPCYDALFYYEDNDGNRTYKWWNGKDNSEDGDDSKGWQDYECRIIHKFLQQYTRDWIERSYYYNIELLDGTLDADAKAGERPLKDVCEVIPILEDSKISVLSNLKGGMKWLK